MWPRSLSAQALCTTRQRLRRVYEGLRPSNSPNWQNITNILHLYEYVTLGAYPPRRSAPPASASGAFMRGSAPQTPRIGKISQTYYIYMNM